MKNYRIPALVLLSLVCAGLCFYCYSPSFRNYDSRPARFFNDRGQLIQGTLYVPRVSSPDVRFPALVTVHYGLQNREALQPGASSMAEQGVVVLEMILRRKDDNGRSRTIANYVEDVNFGVEYLTLTDNVDRKRIYLSGHSIGGNLACIVGGANKDVAGVAPVGYPVEFPPEINKPMLLSAGVFDELHQPSKLLAAYRKTFKDPARGAVLDDYRKITGAVRQDGAVRIMFFSYLSDHYLEPLDYDITAAMTRFVRAWDPGEVPPGKISPVKYRLKILARPILFLALVFLFGYGLFRLKGTVSRGQAVDQLMERFPMVLFIILFFALGLFLRPGEMILPIVVLSALFISLLGFNHFNRKIPASGNDSPKSRFACFEGYGAKVICFGVLIYLCFAAGLYLHAGVYPYSNIRRFFMTLPGIFFMSAGTFYVVVSRINGLFLTPEWLFNFTSAPVWIILVVEFFRPGAVGYVLDLFFTRVIGALKNLDFKIKWNFSPAAAVLLVVVLCGAILSWKHILAEGYAVSPGDLLGLVYLFFCFILVPVVIFTLLIRFRPLADFLDSLGRPGVPQPVSSPVDEAPGDGCKS